jgi:DNA-binding CsgD family transcriptional regulator/tetratricopeptide (TPR) repeat protein
MLNAGVLVGRERQLSVLRSAVDAALRGDGQLVLISGEPGNGKTRLAQEVETIAAAQGMQVLWGRSTDVHGSPPYWPWAEIVRAFAHGRSPDELQALVGTAGSYLALIAPDLFGHVRFDQRASSLQPEVDRFRLLNAVRTFLHRASEVVPLVVMLEDLHRFDQGSLMLLELVGLELRRWRVLVLATYREDELSQPLVQTIGELARVGVRRLGLQGLAMDDTGRLLAGVSGSEAPADVVRLVHERTNGNPFFVTEIGRLHTSDPSIVPDNVRAAIALRLQRLRDTTQRLLVVSALVGREFDFPVVAAALSEDEGVLLHSLDEALTGLLIEPLPSRGPEWYQFRHALIRDVLCESLSPSRRARWHAALVTAFEQVRGAWVDEQATEIAHHAAQAGALVGSASLLRYSRLAGERMLAAHAFAEALPFFERAWTARRAGPLDADAASILEGLGQAQAATAVRWNRQHAWANLRQAVEYYISAGDIDRGVSAVTHTVLSPEGVADVAGVIERILAHVPPGSLQEGALLGRLAAAIYFETGNYERAHSTFARSIGIAAAHHDVALELRTLAHATSVDHFHLRWQDALAKTRRALDLARSVDDLHSETYARYRAAYVLLHTGRPDEAKTEAQANLTAAERLRDHGLLADALYVLATLAQMTGNWTEARAHSDRGLALSPEHLPLLLGRVIMECETGCESESQRYLQRLLDADRRAAPYPIASTFTAIALAEIAHMSGSICDSREAMAAVRSILSRPLCIPNAVVTARLSRALFAIRDERIDECEAELEFLDPYVSLMPSQNCLVLNRVLGLLARAAGQQRRALARFEAARVFCQQSRYRPELARTCYDYAATLLGTGRREDRVKAAALIDEGFRIASELGLQPLAGRMAAFRERYRLRLERKPAGLTTRELEILRLVAAGKTNKEIGQALYISTHTVAVHVAHVLGKTGASNRTEAAAYATRHHLIDPLSSSAESHQPRK